MLTKKIEIKISWGWKYRHGIVKKKRRRRIKYAIKYAMLMVLRIVILLHFLKNIHLFNYKPFQIFFLFLCTLYMKMHWMISTFILFSSLYFLIPPRNYLGFLTGRALLVNNLICTLPEHIFQLKPEDMNVRLSPASLGGHILQWVCLPKMSVCHSKQKTQQWYFFLFFKESCLVFLRWQDLRVPQLIPLKQNKSVPQTETVTTKAQNILKPQVQVIVYCTLIWKATDQLLRIISLTPFHLWIFEALHV